MTEVTIGLGIALSLILSESLGVTAGGVIVPGYIAMHLHNPDQIIMTFFASIIVIFLIRKHGWHGITIFFINIKNFTHLNRLKTIKI